MSNNNVVFQTNMLDRIVAYVGDSRIAYIDKVRRGNGVFYFVRASEPFNLHAEYFDTLEGAKAYIISEIKNLV